MTDSVQEPIRYEHRSIIMDRLRRKVTAAGNVLELTVQEYAFLELFLSQSGQVVTRQRIARAIWNMDTAPDTNLIDVYVLRLRKKIAAADVHGDGPRIHTIRGIGYTLE